MRPRTSTHVITDVAHQECHGAGSGYADITLVGAVLLAACGHLLIKYGLTTITPSAGSLVQRMLACADPGVVAGLMIYGIGTLCWVVTVSKQEISYLYPITAVNYVLIALGGAWFFKEPVSLRRWLGILVVMLGVALLQKSGEGAKS